MPPFGSECGWLSPALPSGETVRGCPEAGVLGKRDACPTSGTGQRRAGWARLAALRRRPTLIRSITFALQ